MDFFMPAERVLYDRSYFFSDEALEEYTAEVADRDGVDIDEVASSAELMDEVHWEIDKAIDRDLLDEICNFDSMLQELKRGDVPEHPTEISVVAKGTVERWDRPSRGLVVADSLRSLVSSTGSADALKDCQIDRIVDTNGELHIEASHHDGSAYLDVRLISGVSFDAKGFKLGGEYYAPGKMSTGDFHILLDNLYDSPGVGPCSLPRFAERAYGTARESYRFGETKFDIYKGRRLPRPALHGEDLDGRGCPRGCRSPVRLHRRGQRMVLSVLPARTCRRREKARAGRGRRSGEEGGRVLRRGRCRGCRRHQTVKRSRKDRDMAEKYEPDEWEAVVCNGFTAVNVLSSNNVEELGWDFTEMELDPTGTCGLFDGMLLDWDDDTPEERREHEEYFPDAFTVGARILADEWDHELSNDEVRSRCFLIIEHADQFTDHDTGRDWLCESTLADFSEVEAMTFFQNLTLMEPQDIAELDGLPIIPSAGPEKCRAAVLAFNQKMIARRRERGLGDAADPGSVVKKTAPAPKPAAPKREQTIRGLGRVDFSGLGYGWGTEYPDSLSVNAIGIDYQSGERNAILNFSPITHAVDVDSRKFFCHETTMGYDRNADSWSGATIGPDFWTFDGEEAREFAENIGFDRLAARACAQLGIDAPGLKGREALPIPKAIDVAPEPGAQAEAAKAAAGKKLSGEGGGGMRI